MKFRQIIDSIELSEERKRELIYICAEWGRYSDALSRMTRYEVLELLHYLVTERASGRRLLERAISRFNRLNALRKENLYGKLNTTQRSEVRSTEGSSGVSAEESGSSGVGISSSDGMQELE